jgi:hypothetical protein
MTAMGMPAGASSNSPMGACPFLTIISLITMLVEVLMSETELVRIDAKARGRSSRDGLVPLRAAMPRTTGRKKAVAAVLLMKTESSEAETITTATSNSGRSPARVRILWPTVSTMPVCDSAAVMMNRPRIITTVPLPKPASASSGGMRPVPTTASSTPSATTSAGMRSHENRMTATARMARQSMISTVIVSGPPQPALAALRPAAQERRPGETGS